MAIQIRGHALVYRIGSFAHYFSPSRFVEGASILLPKSFFQKAFGKDYGDFEKAVHEYHGSYNEVRVAGLLGESSNTKRIKSRSHGSREVIYKRMPTMEEGISPYADPNCTCADSRQTDAKYLSQSTKFDCSHAEAYKIVEFLKKQNGISLLSFDYDLPSSNGPTPLLSFGRLLLKENQAKFVEALKTIHTKGEKAYDRQMADGGYLGLLNKYLKTAMEAGQARWEVIKGNETFPSGRQQHQLSHMKKNLLELGFKPHGTVLEFADQTKEDVFPEQAAWDFEKNGLHVRIVETDLGCPLYAVVLPLGSKEEKLRPEIERQIAADNSIEKISIVTDYATKKRSLQKLAKEAELSETLDTFRRFSREYPSRQTPVTAGLPLFQ